MEAILQSRGLPPPQASMGGERRTCERMVASTALVLSLFDGVTEYVDSPVHVSLCDYGRREEPYDVGPVSRNDGPFDTEIERQKNAFMLESAHTCLI